VCRQRIDISALEHNLPLIGAIQAGNDSQGSGLSATRWPKEGIQFTGTNFKIKCVKRNHVFESAGYISQFE
jgi:hypothetical protein